MKPRAIGILAGGGGPIGSASVLQDIIAECQRKYGSCRSYEYPCINFYSFPYSEMLLSHQNVSGTASRELSYCIQQLKNLGMEIIVIPCFTMCSYLTFRSYGVELIEMGTLMQHYFKNNSVPTPLVLCSDRTRRSGYCDMHFDCQYPNDSLQKEVSNLIEEALKGQKVDPQPILDKLPDVPIVSAAASLNAQLKKEPLDSRWINPNKILAQYVVQRSFAKIVENLEFSNTVAFAKTINGA